MLIQLKHPLLTHKLTLLRRKETTTKDFRETLEEIAGLMAYEITRDLPVKNITVETPLGECKTQELAMDVVLVPVLRAGLGMVDGISNLIPTARVGHIGMYRDHETLKPMTYYSKFPDNLPDAVVMILDPPYSVLLVATCSGCGTIKSKINSLIRRGCNKIQTLTSAATINCKLTSIALRISGRIAFVSKIVA